MLAGRLFAPSGNHWPRELSFYRDDLLPRGIIVLPEKARSLPNSRASPPERSTLILTIISCQNQLPFARTEGNQSIFAHRRISFYHDSYLFELLFNTHTSFLPSATTCKGLPMPVISKSCYSMALHYLFYKKLWTASRARLYAARNIRCWAFHLHTGGIERKRRRLIMVV